MSPGSQQPRDVTTASVITLSQPHWLKKESGAQALDQLKSGREHFERRAWSDAFEALTFADAACPLETEDLERLAMSAYLIGRDDDYLKTLVRTYRAFLADGNHPRAVHCAFWIGLGLLFRGETGPASGWFSRAKRIVEQYAGECAEAGYLLIARAERCLDESDAQVAFAAATMAVEAGERFRDADLAACARHLQGRALLQQGQVEEGFALLDEAMVAVVAGELSPRMTGLVYCSVIDCCMKFYAFARAREWTFALSRWCEAQPQLVSFRGGCLVHRLEIMQLHGDWPDAIQEAHRAWSGSTPMPGQQVPAAAFYRQGELHRLRGEFAAAEESYRIASTRGLEPQPGLALLRMAQGRVDVSVTAIRRAVSVASDPLRRTTLLPACVEILLVAGDVKGARSACADIEAIAEEVDTDVLRAIAAHASGAVELAQGDAAMALCSLRHAFEFWQGAEAPYQMARARELVGLAYRVLGDEEGAGLELAAARAVYQTLGASPDLDRIASHVKEVDTADSHGLTERELQVLRLVTAGKTNKAIALELFVSRRTVDRHVGNIFGKLDVSSRAAAVSFAYTHRLI